MTDTQTTSQLLERLLERRTQRDVAPMLGVSTRELRRWTTGEVVPPDKYRDLIQTYLSAPAGGGEFRFVDLFAGIGGIRSAFDSIGGTCVFTSEWNKFAALTYEANFRNIEQHKFVGDITSVPAAKVPQHDVLLAGFPCQPFSIAGVSKKNSLGRAHGFEDETQGTLFFDVKRIIAAHRPTAFMLENVRNLEHHDKGRTFEVITSTLREELSYHLFWKVMDASPWVPQGRKRIIIIGFNAKDADGKPLPKPAFSFDQVAVPERRPTMADILHPEDGSEQPERHYTVGAKAQVDQRYTLTPNLWAYLQNYAAKHRSAGNGFGFGLVDGSSVARTLSARYYKDGSEILVDQGPGNRPRKLTPRECARLMGFPEDFNITVSDMQAYKQFGNSVVVPMVTAVAEAMRPYILDRVQSPLEAAS